MHIDSDDLRYYGECRERRINSKNRRRQELSDKFSEAMSDQELTLGIPSGKSLQEPVLRALERAGITVGIESPRQILAQVRGLRFLDRVALCTPSVMPVLISKGIVPFGLTGSDTVGEFDDFDRDTEEPNATLEICAEFPLSKATANKTRAVMFVRENDAVTDMESLMRLVGSEQPIDLATEYSSATIKFLWKHGIRGNLFCVRGSAETFVLLGHSRFGVALTETGETLRQNGLRIIGELFQSGTALVANRAFTDLPAGKELIRKLTERLNAVL